MQVRFGFRFIIMPDEIIIPIVPFMMRIIEIISAWVKLNCSTPAIEVVSLSDSGTIMIIQFQSITFDDLAGP